MYKRSLLDKIKNNFISKYFRNRFNLSPIFIDTSKISKSSIISDTFLWRTDNGYETVFKFSDILRIFLQKTGTVAHFQFYDKDNKFVFEKKMSKLDFSNKLKINEDFLNGIRNFGYFTVFFQIENFQHYEKVVFSNRCYLGFSKNSQNPSMVHGNTYSISKTFDFKYEFNNFVGTSLFQKQEYLIQNSFDDFDFSELIFVNPTSKIVRFSLCGKKYLLEKYSSKIIEIKKEKLIKIKSNCYWLRPIIFNYKNNYMDVYHS